MHPEWVFARRRIQPLVHRMSRLLLVCSCFLCTLVSADAGMMSSCDSVCADRDLLNQSCVENWLQKFRVTELKWTESDSVGWNVALTTAAPAKVDTPASRIKAVERAEPNHAEDWSAPFEPQSLEANLFGTHCPSSGNCGCGGTSVANTPGGCSGIVPIVVNQTFDFPTHNFLGRLSQENFFDIPSGIALEMLRPPQILIVLA